MEIKELYFAGKRWIEDVKYTYSLIAKKYIGKITTFGKPNGPESYRAGWDLDGIKIYDAYADETGIWLKGNFGTGDGVHQPEWIKLDKFIQNGGVSYSLLNRSQQWLSRAVTMIKEVATWQ